MKLLSLLVAVLLITPNAFAQSEYDLSCETIPVEVEFKDEQLSHDPEIRQAQERIVRLVKHRVSKIASCEHKLPDSAFSGKGQMISMDDLFQAPKDQIDLRALARDENGEPKDLTEEQINQIAKTGTFTVEDTRFPGKYHVWKISSWLQEGSDSIKIVFNHKKASALAHVYVYVPQVLWKSESWSVANGITNIGRALKDVTSNVIGLSNYSPKYSETEIASMIAKEKIKHALEESLHVASPGNEFVFVVSDGIKLDLSLFDPRIQEKITPILREIKATQDNYWVKNEKIIETELYKEYQNDPSVKNIDQKVVDAIVLQKRLQLFDAYLASEALREVRSNLPELVVNYYKSFIEYYSAEAKFRKDIREYANKVREELQQEFPVKSLMGDWSVMAPSTWYTNADSWLQTEVDKKLQAFALENQMGYYDQAYENLISEGLDQEAYLMAKHLEFVRIKQNQLYQQYKSIEVPSLNQEFYYRHWNSDNYTVENAGTEEDPYYVLNKYYMREVKSDSFGWRGALWWNRTASIWKNSMDAIVYDNMINGPLGLRALFSGKSFPHEWEVDPYTGEKQLVGEMPTYIENLKGVWEYVAKQNEEFENREDYGLFGKTISGFFHSIWYEGVVGLGGSVVVGIGQPVVTLANTAASALLTGTSFVWAPVVGALHNVSDIALYDTASPGDHRNFSGHSAKVTPLFQNAFKTVLGGAESLTSAALGVVWHPAMFLLKGAYGYISTGIEVAYEWLVKEAVIEVFARVPAIDTDYVTRIQGPGLESAYFFQVDSAIALVAMQAVLENVELSFYEGKATTEIRRPVRDLEALMTEVMLPFLSNHTIQGDIRNEVTKATGEFIKALEENLKQRKEELNKVNEFAQRRVEDYRPIGEKIRLTKSELIKTLKLASVMVEEFMTKRVVVAMSEEEVDAFWYENDLRKDNWMGLTEKYFTKVFSEDFLVPLEDESSDFIIRVSTNSLGDTIDAIVNKDYELKAQNKNAELRTKKVSKDVTSDLVDVSKEELPIPYLLKNPSYLGDGKYLVEDILKDREDLEFIH